MKQDEQTKSFLSLASVTVKHEKMNLLLQPFFCKNNVQGSLKNFFNDYQPMLLPHEIRRSGPPRYYKWEKWRFLLLKCVKMKQHKNNSKLSLSFTMKLWKTQEVCAAHLLHVEWTLRQMLAVSSPRQGRTNQGLLVIQTFACSLPGNQSGDHVLLLRMALTTALGKYNKQGRLNIPNAAASLSHKKVGL